MTNLRSFEEIMNRINDMQLTMTSLQKSYEILAIQSQNQANHHLASLAEQPLDGLHTYKTL